MSEIASMHRNINMRRYITSAHGHELSGLFVHMLIIIIYAWADYAWVAK